MALPDLPLSGLTSRGTPDRANDYIYVVNGATQYRSTINNELGITGTPVGTTDTQTLTNKTLTAPTITSPVLSGTVTGTYTLGGTPTFPASVVTLTGSQTLTNKILTSPTISSPTITNASMTADSISGFTTANTGTIYGIAITSGAVSGASITANTIPGTALNGTYRTIRQNNTTDTTESAARILTGWGIIANSAVSALAKNVTFNSAFTSPPIVFAVCGGDSAAGTTYGSGGINISGGVMTEAHTVTTTSFTIYMKKQDGTNFAGGNTFYQWIAIGT